MISTVCWMSRQCPQATRIEDTDGKDCFLAEPLDASLNCAHGIGVPTFVSNGELSKLPGCVRTTNPSIARSRSVSTTSEGGGTPRFI